MSTFHKYQFVLVPCQLGVKFQNIQMSVLYYEKVEHNICFAVKGSYPLHYYAHLIFNCTLNKYTNIVKEQELYS